MKKEQSDEIFDFLKEKEYIYPGKKLESSFLCTLFNEDDVKSMNYRGPMLDLRTKIEESGIYVKLIKNSIYMYEKGKIIFASKQRIKRASKLNKRNQQTLSNANLSWFSSEQKKEYYHQLAILNALNKKSNLSIS